MRIEKRAIKFWKHLKMSDSNSYLFKALKNHEVNAEKSPLIIYSDGPEAANTN